MLTPNPFGRMLSGSPIGVVAKVGLDVKVGIAEGVGLMVGVSIVVLVGEGAVDCMLVEHPNNMKMVMLIEIKTLNVV